MPSNWENANNVGLYYEHQPVLVGGSEFSTLPGNTWLGATSGGYRISPEGLPYQPGTIFDDAAPGPLSAPPPAAPPPAAPAAPPPAAPPPAAPPINATPPSLGGPPINSLSPPAQVINEQTQQLMDRGPPPRLYIPGVTDFQGNRLPNNRLKIPGIQNGYDVFLDDPYPVQGGLMSSSLTGSNPQENIDYMTAALLKNKNNGFS